VNTVLVDSNVLLDIATDDKRWSAWSAQALEAVANEAPLAINVVIYGEISIGFSRIEDLELAIPLTLFRREAIPYEAAFLAGKAFSRYRRRGGVRVRPLPDFYIGAHAAVAGFRLLTRDPRRYRNYFPSVKLITP
jgi:predicted nucleic acid-binding protein